MLQLNDEKWETCLFSTDPTEARWHQNITIGNQAIPTTAYARVLGWHLRQATQHHEERGSQKQLPYAAGWCGFGLDAAPAWGPWISKTNRDKLERTQLKAANIMSGMLRSTPTEAVLQEAGLETVADMHDAADLCLYDRWRGLPGETTGERLPRGRWGRGHDIGLPGEEMEGLIRRESLGVGGDAPQGLGATQSYSEVPEVKHNKNCTSKTTSSSSGPAQYALLATLGHFLFIYMFYIQIRRHMQHSITQSTACGST